MIFPIISTSALEYYLSPISLNVTSIVKSQRILCNLPLQYDLTYQTEYVKYLADDYGLSLPLQVMACNAKKRVLTNEMHCHTRPKNLPDRSFIRLDDSLWICSPELCVTQIASAMPLVKLIRAINHLCAIYVANPNAPYLQSSRDPLTTVQSISGFVGRAPGLKGISKTRQALRYALDRSNSPMESDFAVLFTLPISLGGYALPKPLLNRNTRLFSNVSSLHLSSVCCDFVWPDQKIIVEYDSNLSHLDPDQHAYDKGKHNALTLSGYKVINITTKDVKDFPSVDRTFRLIRKELGLRAFSTEFEKYYSLRRQNVLSLLFNIGV